MGTEAPIWTKSTRSFSNSNCVEVAKVPGGGVGVRDSKDPHRAALWFTPAEWAAFVEGVKAGEFDHFADATPAPGGE